MAKKKNLNTPKTAEATATRKREVAGIMLIAVAILLGLSIISYNTGDYFKVSRVSFFKLFSPDSTAQQVSNMLGPVGAYLGHFFVHTLFGYTSVIIPGILTILGWHIFRHRQPRELYWPSILALWGMLILSSIFGWIYNAEGPVSSVWAGGSGVAISNILQNILGVGSIILLSVFALITGILLIDRDLQKTVDNVKSWLRRLNEKLDERKSERAQQKEIRLREKEAQKELKAAQKEEKKAEAKKTVAEPIPVVEKEESLNEQEKIVAPPIEEIIKESEEKEKARLEAEEKEKESIDTRPRAILEKPKKEESKSSDEEEDDDVEVNVIVGEGDEEAGDKDLDKLNKEVAKEVPVIRYKFPSIDILDTPPADRKQVNFEEIQENKRIILDKLKRHKIEILSINAIVGPTVTLYELEPAPDVKISKIESYANDIKMATAAYGLRIIAPIPGKSAVGIEVPNSTTETVYIKQMINTKKFVETDYDLPVAFGKTIENEVFMIDLRRMPHLLMAGATGSGKSVGVNTIITCLLYKCHPDNLKFVMIDPKKIELSLYQHIKDHFLAQLPHAEEPIVTDTSKALETLNSVCKEMDERYDLLKMAMVRDIKDYNDKFKSGVLDEELGHRHLPYIVVIIDELADLMMTAGKQIEEPIARLAQLARAIGIHLVVATQRPSVNVITGTIKANFPARIAYQVASKVDSRTIIDMGGADQLIGRGDMLFHNGAGTVRIQNAFVSTPEVERITSFIGAQAGFDKPFFLPVVEEEVAGMDNPLDDIDELFESAAKVVILHQQGSVSLLQRKLKIGYNRAGRIIDQLFGAGIVGPYQGSTARDVLVSTEEELEDILDDIRNQ